MNVCLTTEAILYMCLALFPKSDSESLHILLQLKWSSQDSVQMDYVVLDVCKIAWTVFLNRQIPEL